MESKAEYDIIDMDINHCLWDLESACSAIKSAMESANDSKNAADLVDRVEVALELSKGEAKWWEAKAKLFECELLDYRVKKFDEDEPELSRLKGWDRKAAPAVEEWERFRESHRELFDEIRQAEKDMWKISFFWCQGCTDDEIAKVGKLQDHIAAVRKEIYPEPEFLAL